MEYWVECISEALSESNIEASVEQIKAIAEFVEGAHENYGMATGNDVADSNFISDDARKLSDLESEIDARNRWEQSTDPCKQCNTSGIVLDGWSRDVKCRACNGSGRI